MIRPLRRRHLTIWAVLGPVLTLGVIALLLLRPPTLAPPSGEATSGETP